MLNGPGPAEDHSQETWHVRRADGRPMAQYVEPGGLDAIEDGGPAEPRQTNFVSQASPQLIAEREAVVEQGTCSGDSGGERVFPFRRDSPGIERALISVVFPHLI